MTSMLSIRQIPGRASEIAEGMNIQRFLPQRSQRMVGAWCFLDLLGPIKLADGQTMQVGAHPHIGLQTFTWMLEGEILHTDSLGNQQIIRPGEINLMTAGHGISHTEYSLPGTTSLHAAQLWIALPPDMSDCQAAFQHIQNLPSWQMGDVKLTLLAGEYQGLRSPCQVHSPLIGLDLTCVNAASLTLDVEPGFEHAVLVLRGRFAMAGEVFDGKELVYLPPGVTCIDIDLAANSQVLLIGGEPFEEPIQMWWNFVAFDRATIIQAQNDWQAQHERFGQVPQKDAKRLHAPPLPWRPES